MPRTRRVEHHHPFAYCPQCGAYGYRGLIHEKCTHSIAGKICKGKILSAVRAEDWKHCERCQNAGSIDHVKCVACQGTGWVLVRSASAVPALRG